MDKIKSLVSLFFSPTPETSQISGITIGQEYCECGLVPDHPKYKSEDNVGTGDSPIFRN